MSSGQQIDDLCFRPARSYGASNWPPNVRSEECPSRSAMAEVGWKRPKGHSWGLGALLRKFPRTSRDRFSADDAVWNCFPGMLSGFPQWPWHSRRPAFSKSASSRRARALRVTPRLSMRFWSMCHCGRSPAFHPQRCGNDAGWQRVFCSSTTAAGRRSGLLRPHPANAGTGAVRGGAPGRACRRYRPRRGSPNLGARRELSAARRQSGELPH